MEQQRAAIYARQSFDNTGEELGIQRQLEQCEALCVARNYRVTEVITENSVSATKGERPGYKQLISLIGSRAVDVVVVLRMDRLLRKLTDLETLIDLSETTGVGIAAVDGNYDLSTANGRLVGRLLAVAARGEVEMKNERRILANKQAAALGKPYGTGRAYGYQSGNTELEPSEAAVLHEMAKKVIQGMSFVKVASWATSEGHRTVTGKQWRSITVRNRLLNLRYAGIREYNGVQYNGNWEPVFDKPTWERLQLALRHRAIPSPSPRPRSYLLTGLLYCGRCDHSMIGSNLTRAKGETYKGYICPRQSDGCGLTKSAIPLDHLVTQSVLYRLDSPALGSFLDATRDDGQLSQLLEQRSALQARLDGFADDYALGILTKAQMARATQTAQTELGRLDSEISRLQVSNISLPVGQTLSQAWQSETLNWRQSLLALVLKRVVAYENNGLPYYFVDQKRYRFDPESIGVEWIA